MKVLLASHAFLPRSLAGVEVYTARLARALQDLGHEVAVLTAAHDLAATPYASRRTRLGSIEVFEIVNPHLDGALAGTYCVPQIDRAIETLLGELRPDCVHAQHLLNLSTGLLEACCSQGVPLVLTLHDYWLSCPRDGIRMRADGGLCQSVEWAVCARCLAASPQLVPPLQRGASRALQALGLGPAVHAVHRRAPRGAAAVARLLRRLRPVPVRELPAALEARAAHLRERVSRATAILTPTRFARDRAVDWGIPGERVRVAPLGVIEGPPKPRGAGPRRRFGYLGTLAPHKGVHVLVEALRRLPHPEVTLDVVGNQALDPSYSRSLRALAGDDRRIRFRGAIAEGEQQRLWPSLDALVVPSLWWENSPLVVLEALAAGLPVLASRTGGVPELLPEAAGALLPPGDVGALAAALGALAEGRLLAEALTPLPLKTCREGAQELVGLYSDLRSCCESAR